MSRGMEAPSTLALLRDALDSQEWSTAAKVLNTLPVELPVGQNHVTIAKGIDTVRASTDALIEVCTFVSSFDAVYQARETLVAHGAIKWAAKALVGFKNNSTVVSRLATLLCLLGLSTRGRTYVGITGAVDVLTKTWRKEVGNLQLVTALGSLCAGHIDNVSRVMRQKGISAAIDVLRDQNYADYWDLLEKILILVGFCTICTPDREREANELVPSIIGVLEKANAQNKPNTAVHAIIALGNIGDCWIKERDGYNIPQPTRLVDALVKAWATFPRAAKLIEAVSRTILVLSTTHIDVRSALVTHSKALNEVIALRRNPDSVVRAVQHLLETQDYPDEKHNNTDAAPVADNMDHDPSEGLIRGEADVPLDTEADDTRFSDEFDTSLPSVECLPPPVHHYKRAQAISRAQARQDDERQLDSSDVEFVSRFSSVRAQKAKPKKVRRSPRSFHISQVAADNTNPPVVLDEELACGESDSTGNKAAPSRNEQSTLQHSRPGHQHKRRQKERKSNFGEFHKSCLEYRPDEAGEDYERTPPRTRQPQTKEEKLSQIASASKAAFNSRRKSTRISLSLKKGIEQALNLQSNTDETRGIEVITISSDEDESADSSRKSGVIAKEGIQSGRKRCMESSVSKTSTPAKRTRVSNRRAKAAQLDRLDAVISRIDFNNL